MMSDIQLAREFWRRSQYWEAISLRCWVAYLIFEAYVMPKRSMRRIMADFQQGNKL